MQFATQDITVTVFIKFLQNELETYVFIHKQLKRFSKCLRRSISALPRKGLKQLYHLKFLRGQHCPRATG
jgi:hypothetical protein